MLDIKHVLICGTSVQAILDKRKLTRLAGGDREGQNLAQNGPRLKPDEKLLASALANGKFLAQSFVKGRGAPLGTFRTLFINFRQKIDSLRPLKTLYICICTLDVFVIFCICICI